MRNRNVDAARRYHDATKHSYASVRADRHVLDWDNQPLPFKIYTDLSPIPLPRDFEASGIPALDAIARVTPLGARAAVPHLATLAHVLFLSAGVTRVKQYPGGQIPFRAASCTGALYEIDLYVVCGDLPGLEAGVYHFGPHDFALRCLRRGDHRAALVRATAEEPSVAHAPVLIVCTGTYWRNAWKYRARTYRHFGWDNGTILANLLAACAALDLPARILCGFVDAPVNELLALDTDREVAFSMVALGRRADGPAAAPKLAPLSLATVPLSAEEVDYPLMRELHAASALDTEDEVRAWRGAPPVPAGPPASGLILLRPSADVDVPQDSNDEVVRRRGSTRRFRRGAAWTFEQFSTALCRSTRGIPADFLEDSQPNDRPGPLLNRLYVIVHAVEGLATGAYVLHRDPCALEPLKTGSFRDEAGYLGLDQDLPADASFVVFFVADLTAILDRFGNRGYRAVQLEAGILGGKLYLAAYAQRLGASGLTFYDDDVVRFFSPHAAGASAIFCMTLGRSVKLVQTVPVR